MISTLTSAIALPVGSVLEQAAVAGEDLPGALFTLTLLTGAVMLAMELLRLAGLAIVACYFNTPGGGIGSGSAGWEDHDAAASTSGESPSTQTEPLAEST